MKWTWHDSIDYVLSIQKQWVWPEERASSNHSLYNLYYEMMP